MFQSPFEVSDVLRAIMYGATPLDLFQSPFEVSDVLSIVKGQKSDHSPLFQSPFEVSDVLRLPEEVAGTLSTGFNPLSRFLTY